ncbi:carrier superfamily protein [Besnoitia besnoiti]|uniref:Carrier superfamily protein n=1 Tax=Besnoitia besnoiti TaxID=94643 RepID=A0A2A9MQA5_BESBE|nr:carrier superfamily protein [Besnoitia besnoiti]PFH38170.1 carrier superfamily protein [Besnoitia besnoiti]
MNLEQVLVSSTVSGLLVGSICTPFDVVKNFWQFNPACAANRASLSASHVVRLLYSQQGVSGFWRGVVPAYATIIPANVTFFLAYERRRPDESPAWAGVKARAAAVLVTAPMELARTKMQASIGIPGQNQSFRQVLSQMIQIGGVFSLWKGVIPTLVRDLPFSAIYWQTTEYMKAWVERLAARSAPAPGGYLESSARRMRQRGDAPFSSIPDTSAAGSPLSAHVPSTSACCSPRSSAASSSCGAPTRTFVSSSLFQSFVFPFFSGAAASAVACVVTHPFDVLKTNVQASCHQMEPNLRQMGYLHLVSRGFVDVARTVYAQQGLRGFTVGLTPRLLKIVPSCAVLLASYEVTKYLCSQSLIDSM